MPWIKESDQEVIEKAMNWLDKPNETPAWVYLVTVAKTWGSSPRPAGSVMAVNSEGNYTGSISGGCVEQDLIKRLMNIDHEHAVFPEKFTYGIDEEETHRFALPCGSRLDLIVEKLETQAQVKPALDAINTRQRIGRHVCLNTGEVSFSKKMADKDFLFDNNSMKKAFGPAWRLLIIGAGHLTQYVAQMAAALNYQIIVCEPRENQAKNWDLENTELYTGMPDDLVKKYVTDSRCAVLALTHTPNLDDMALMEALDSQAFYVGALGSKKANDMRRNRLKALGVSEAGINRLHGPVGLPIGSHTPAEIAISILADITALRHGIHLVQNDLIDEIIQSEVPFLQ